MLQAITQALQNGSSSAIAPALAFALGLVSAGASACCTLPAMGMLVAYSGTRESMGRRGSLTSALWFLLGASEAHHRQASCPQRARYQAGPCWCPGGQCK